MNSVNNATMVLIRLKELFAVESDKKLADAIGVSTPTISAWRQRDSTPYEVCMQVASDKGISLDWLLTGEGNMYRNSLPKSQLDPEIQAVVTIMADLDRAQKTTIRAAAENEKRYSVMQRELLDLRQHRQASA